MKDLRKVAKDLGELTDDNTLQEMIERADFDQDGVVSEQEFYNLLTKKAYWFELLLLFFNFIYIMKVDEIYIDWLIISKNFTKYFCLN